MNTRFDKHRVLSVIENTITPYIGEHMAKASTQVHCEKLGIVSSEMGSDEMRALLDRLGKAMLVFVGKEKSDGILDEIRQTVGLGG